jgi:putative DNA primase/helicase
VNTTDTYNSSEAKQKIQYETYALDFLLKKQVIIAGGQAYEYDGKHYVPVSKLKVNLRRWMKAQKIPQTNTLVDNVYPIIEAFATTDKVLPCWNTGAVERIIPFSNGLLRLKPFLESSTIDIIPHTPNYLSTWCIPGDFDKEAKCPRWLTFLGECLEGEADQVSLCQEWFGYVLSGDTNHQKYMAHIGARGSGKSTVARILQHMVGSGAVAFDLRRLAGRFGLGALQGKSLAVCGEVELTGCKERAEIIERLKSLTGNDTQQIERKGDNVFRSEAIPSRFHIISNTVPLLRDPSLALARRMLILWSPSSAAEADLGLEEKLVAELPGIGQWALAGCGRLHRMGRFTNTARMKGELGAIERDASPLIAFLRDRCQVHKSLDGGTLPDVEWVDGPNFKEQKDKIWAAATQWELETQTPLPEVPVWFWRDLRSVLPRISPDRRREKLPNGKLVDVIEGVRLKT